MIGGIYCESYIGRVYDEGKFESIHVRMNRLFGSSLGLPSNKTLTQQIIDAWYNLVSRKMGRILSSWRVPGSRGYYNRTVDLTRSICMGVYKNGKLRRMYRFTGGSNEKETTGKERHPDPSSRAEQFLNEYDLVHKNDYAIVIAATMPYAVRLEVEYGYNVLHDVINRMISSIEEYSGGKSNSLYGYIFESTGGYGG